MFSKENMALHYQKIERSLEEEERFKILSAVATRRNEPRKPGTIPDWYPEGFIIEESTCQKKS